MGPFSNLMWRVHTGEKKTLRELTIELYSKYLTEHNVQVMV